MAGKDNDNESQIDKTSFFWAANCGICHPGGGAGEFDRDGQRYYDVATGEFGYEALGKTAGDVTLDGDYAFLNTGTGALSAAAWDVTGVSEPDCLLCHRRERTVLNGTNMNWVWRSGTLRGSAALVDSAGDSVPAFAAAPTAGQGWLSSFELAQLPAGNPPKATTLQIDYSVGVDDGSLVEDADGHVAFAGTSMSKAPKDYACWGCHAIADQKKRGRVWFDAAQDVHYAAFNHLDDDDTSNDVAAGDSTACTRCHPSEMSHNFAKGSSFLGSVQNETDYQDFRTCGDCHLADSATRESDAPSPTNATIHTDGHLAAMSCQFCHVPFKANPAQLVVDNAVTGSTVGYNTDAFLSADPLDPDGGDRTRWYPSAKIKTDPDGIDRLYPVKLLLSVWWGDWDQAGTPDDMSDDLVVPIPLWRVRQITGGSALGVVADDNGDGKGEVNSAAEILAYIAALQGNDSYGRQVAATPVLVKGGHIWYADAGATDGLGFVDYKAAGIVTESSHPFSADHNVLPTEMALGSNGCGACHKSFNGGQDTNVFDRLILVDPYDMNGDAVYESLRDLTGVDPF